MRGVALLSLGLVVILSGCLGGDADSTPDAGVEAGTGQAADTTAQPGDAEAIDIPQPLTYEGSFRLLANDTAVAGQHLLMSQESDNCVRLDDKFRVVSGTAVATWDGPTGPMELVLAVAGEPKVVVAINPVGAGPFSATIDLAGLDNREGDAALVWQASTSDVPASAAVLAEAQLDIAITYLPAPGFLTMTPDDGWTCGVGR